MCVCVCVKTFSEICKYKALKDARELEFFCIDALLFIFVFIVISNNYQLSTAEIAAKVDN